MDYDLSRLNWRSFEQLIQGIGSEVLGPGLIIFGDGPDGGREATINAHLDYPTATDGWSGYTLVQAKFLQRPKGTSADGAWALSQLREELAQYSREDEPRDLPDNMIFVTNVTLSPSETSGAKDRVFALAKETGFKGFDVWDYDKIRVYLDKYEQLRRSFSPYVLSGDVLAETLEALDELKSQRPDFDEVMSRFLQKELIADQWVNLEQAGRSTEEQVPVSRVFVDLPVSEVRQADPPVESSEDLEPGFVAQILETSALRLDPESWNPQRTTQEEDAPESSAREGRVVLVGGPGQGKTTIGQFVCQMFRAALLQSRKAGTMAPEVTDALHALEKHCKAGGLDLPTVRRFPLRIELTKFADELGEAGGCASLLAYIGKIISARVDEDISPSLISTWLRNYPWLLILDGLDEVPASGNRDQLMKAISDLWIDIAGAGSDCLVVATTRPQGYEDEFSPRYYQHLYLTPLSPARALHYADRLLGVRFGTDADRHAEIASRLGRAAARSDTGRLMTSPLQVTIMATLLERMGQPPEGRWNLFSQYYRVIYDRELEREIAAAWVLRDHRPDIDAIHERVGLLLQAEGENAAQAEAQISRDRFAEVVRARLREEELDDDEVLVQQIINAAMERLVFLVPVEADHVGFEIRSLQEFMAAEALLDGKEKIVEKRLRAIAPLSAWRNVFLFAAGRCFSDLQHYRDTINTICGELNDSATDSLAPLALPGSTLAIDLLDDGVANRQTKYERLLSREALRVAQGPPGELCDRLAEVYRSVLQPTYEAELRNAVSHGHFTESLGAWRTLAVLQARGESWARDILSEHLPGSEELGYLLDSLPPSAKSAWLSKTLAELCSTAPPAQSFPYREQLGFLEVVDYAPPWYQVFFHMTTEPLRNSSEVILQFEGVSADLLTASVRMIGKLAGPIQQAVSTLNVAEREIAPQSWEVLFSGIEFLQAPNRKTLSEALKRLAEGQTLTSDSYSGYTGWPLSSLVISAAEGSKDFKELSELASAGAFGDTSDWEASERRWEANGVTQADLTEANGLEYTFDKNIRARGFPLHTATLSVTDSRRKPAPVVLLWLEDVSRPEVRRFLVKVMFWMLEGFYDEETELGVSFQDLASNINQDDLPRQKVLPLALLNSFSWSHDLSPAEAELLEGLGRVFERVDNSDEAMVMTFRDALLNSLNQGEELPGLLRLLAVGLPYVIDEREELIEEALEAHAGPEATPARALLALKLGKEVSSDDILALVVDSEALAVDAVGAVRHAWKPDLRRQMLGALEESLPPERWRLRRDLIAAASSLIGSKPSELATTETWHSLELFSRAVAV